MREQPIFTETIGRVTVEYWSDYDHGLPCKEYDGNVDIYEHSGLDYKKPSERLFRVDRTLWAYDHAEAVRIARRDGWGIEKAEGLTPGQIAEAAVLQNVAFQRGFLDDQWGYVGIVCKMGDAEDSCWGFETYKDYHLEAARDMAAQLELSVSREQAEAQYWADRDVVTTA